MSVYMVCKCSHLAWTSRQPARIKTMRLATDKAATTSCDIWNSKQPKFMPFSVFHLELPATLWLLTKPIGVPIVFTISRKENCIQTALYMHCLMLYNV